MDTLDFILRNGKGNFFGFWRNDDEIDRPRHTRRYRTEKTLTPSEYIINSKEQEND